jgi:hypothetical protein
MIPAIETAFLCPLSLVSMEAAERASCSAHEGAD